MKCVQTMRCKHRLRTEGITPLPSDGDGMIENSQNIIRIVN